MTEHDPTLAAVAAALAGPVPGEETDRLLTLPELAEATGLPVAALEAFEREGLLIPRAPQAEARYTSGDVAALRAGLALLEAGVPLDELLDLARRHGQAMQAIATQAVELFVRFVRDPIAGSAASEQEASERLVMAFHQMLPATAELVAHHFRRLLVREAYARIERDGDEAELAALRQASEQR